MEAGPPEEKVIRLWDLESGALRTLGPLPGAGVGRAGGIADVHFTERDRLLAAVQGTGLVSFDLKSGASQVVVAHPIGQFVASRDGRFAVGTATGRVGGERSPVFRFHLEDGSAQALPDARNGRDRHRDRCE